MNEYETNPQRHEPSSSEEPSHRPAATPDVSQPESGRSDTSAHLASSADSEPPTAALQPVSGPHAVTPPPASPSPWHPGPSFQAPGQQPDPAQPQSAQPYSAQPYPAPSYPGQSYPGQAYPGQAYPGQPQPAYSGHGQYPGQPLHPGQDDTDPGAQMPPWAQHVGADQRGPARSGGGRKVAAIGALAVLLALASGGVGAAVALAVDDGNGAIGTTKTGSSSVTRVVDRSSVAEIAAAVQDSVVSITTGSGEGSGVVLTADGFVLTNNHVVDSARGNAVKVVFANGKSAEATIVGTDPRTDLAVVKADGVTDLKPATFGKSADMKVGDTVLALGSPLGLEGSVTLGIVSAKDRTIRAGGQGQQQPNPFAEQQQSAGVTSMSGLLQTDAPINPGNSGGALVNVAGEVIGINTAIATSGQGAGSIGLGFAIPSDKAKDVADQLMAGKKVSHPALGVSVGEVEGGGAGIKAVTPDSAAAKAGLQQGDIITEINGKPVNDSDDVVAAIQAGKVGDQVTVTYTRNGARKTATATLVEAS